MQHDKIENISCLIFDYGGTLDTNARHWAHVLWDGYRHTMQSASCGAPLSHVSHEQFREAYVFGERALAKAPIVCPTDNFLQVLQKKTTQQLHYLGEQGIWQGTPSQREEAIHSISHFCYDYAARTVQESKAVLDALLPHYRMVLVSNFYGNIEAILRDFHLQHFSHIVESAVVGVRKPDPAIYRLGVEAAGCPASSCLVVGDSFDKDIVPATTVDCHTIWLKGEGWTTAEDDRATAPGAPRPTAIVQRLSDILPLLLP